MSDNNLERNTERLDVKFNASLSFSYKPPYEPLFAERIPVIQAFQYAIANYLSKKELLKDTLLGRFKLLIRPSSVSFRAIECGVYTGSSLIACASMARDFNIPYKIHGLDTFTGFPALSETDKAFAPDGAPYLKRKFFDDTSLESVQKKLAAVGLAGDVSLVQGLFSETLPDLSEEEYHFVNIDCDLYEPHIECLEYFYPRMAKGAVIFFDDYHSADYPMARKAIDKFMKDKPEKLSHLRFGDDAVNRTKSFLVKY